MSTRREEDKNEKRKNKTLYANDQYNGIVGRCVVFFYDCVSDGLELFGNLNRRKLDMKSGACLPRALRMQNEREIKRLLLCIRNWKRARRAGEREEKSEKKTSMLKHRKRWKFGNHVVFSRCVFLFSRSLSLLCAARIFQYLLHLNGLLGMHVVLVCARTPAARRAKEARWKRAQTERKRQREQVGTQERDAWLPTSGAAIFARWSCVWLRDFFALFFLLSRSTRKKIFSRAENLKFLFLPGLKVKLFASRHVCPCSGRDRAKNVCVCGEW